MQVVGIEEEQRWIEVEEANELNIAPQHLDFSRKYPGLRIPSH
jgi:hypothetical protein